MWKEGSAPNRNMSGLCHVRFDFTCFKTGVESPERSELV